jgi:hypothetical protein
MWTLDEVLRAIDRGDLFYTKGVNTGKVALVVKYSCAPCRRLHIRSAADKVTDNDPPSRRYVAVRSWLSVSEEANVSPTSPTVSSAVPWSPCLPLDHDQTPPASVSVGHRDAFDAMPAPLDDSPELSGLPAVPLEQLSQD